MFPTTKNYEYQMYLPVLLTLPPPAARAKSSPPYTSEEASNDNPLDIHIINGWFATAARMFQCAEGCAVLLPDAIGRGKERVPAVSLSLWLCPLYPIPQNTTAPTLNLAISNRTVQVLPPIHFRRGIERQPAIHINGWFVSLFKYK